MAKMTKEDSPKPSKRQKSTRKKIITKIGDVFCVELDGKLKCFFQYIANDYYQLNSSVIRAFKHRYPMEYEPVIKDIVKDEVAFYAHTVLRSGIEFNAWYKVDKSTDVGEKDLAKVLFGCAQEIKIHSENDIERVNPLTNWYIWHINEPHIGVGELPKTYQDMIEIGSVMAYHQIVNRMKYGYYTSSLAEYGLLKRIPLPNGDSFTRITNEKEGIVTYFHFHGEKAVRQIIVLPDRNVKLSAQVPALEGFSMCDRDFSEIGWEYPHFIQEEEFESVWNG